MILTPGTRIGRYEIRSLLGAGGMGEVYSAFDSELNRLVALKFLHADVAADPKRMQRFIQETRAASALNHPNILTVHDIGQAEDGSRFFAAELVDGVTLRVHVRQRRLKLGEVLDLVIQTARALVAAHQAGIVHRDIKPENVMVRADGYVKVLDFGLAKLASPAAPEIGTRAATQAPANTDAGTILGTVAYMSPEQARGQEMDARTDIWSLGVMLHELLTGQVPFAGTSPSHTIVAILDEEPPPLARFVPDAPEALQEIVSDALTKDRDARYQTAKQMLSKLERLEQRLDSEARAVQPGTGASAARSIGSVPPPVSTVSSISSAEYLVNQIKGHRAIAVVVLVLLVLTVAVSGSALYKMASRRQAAAKSGPEFTAMKIARLTDTGKAGSVAISPDGKMVVHVMEGAGQQSLWVRHIATGSNVQIIAPAEVGYGRMTFSPDGNYVYFCRWDKGDRRATLYAVPVLGGEARKVLSDADSSVTFSPGGKRIAFVRWHTTKDENSIITANADGTDERTLATLAGESGRFKSSGPAWSPDGNTIAAGVYANDGGVDYQYLAAVSVGDGKVEPIGSQRWYDVGRVGWLADGSAIVANCYEMGGTVAQYFLFAYPDGSARRITNDLIDYHDLSLTADTRTLATVQEDRIMNIWVAPGADAKSLRQLTSGSQKYEGGDGVAWTIDGKIVFGAFGHDGLEKVWIMDSDGGGQRRLTGGTESHLVDPAVSPDGRYVAFVSTRGSRRHLWRMDIDGGNVRQLTAADSLDGSPTFSPDSRWVVYDSRVGEKLNLLKVPVGGGDPVRLTEGARAFAPAVSPDGTLVACLYHETRDSPLKIAFVPFDGGKPVKLLDLSVTALRVLRWMPNNHALAYVDTKGGVSNVWMLPTDGGKPRQLTDFTSGQIYRFDLGRDGRPTLFSRGVTNKDVVLITGFN